MHRPSPSKCRSRTRRTCGFWARRSARCHVCEPCARGLCTSRVRALGPSTTLQPDPPYPCTILAQVLVIGSGGRGKGSGGAPTCVHILPPVSVAWQAVIEAEAFLQQGRTCPRERSIIVLRAPVSCPRRVQSIRCAGSSSSPPSLAPCTACPETPASPRWPSASAVLAAPTSPRWARALLAGLSFARSGPFYRFVYRLDVLADSAVQPQSRA